MAAVIKTSDTEMVSVSTLTHHPINERIYRMSNISDLVSSISEVGLLTPLVINSSNQVISGNRRLCALTELEWGMVEVQRIDVSDDEVTSLLIHHNKQRVKSSRELLNEYKSLEEIYSIGRGKRTDLETIGRNTKSSTREIISNKLGVKESHIARLLYIDKQDSEFIDLIDDGTLTINQAYWALHKRAKDKSNITDKKSSLPPDTNLYTFYRKSSHRMDEINDGDVQLVFTSPPYWKQRKYSNKNEVTLGEEKTPDEYVTNLVNHLDGVRRVLSDKGSFFLNLGDKFQDMNLLNLPHKVVISLQDRGWLLRNTIIWKKTNSKPSPSKSNLQSTYEYIFHLTKTRKYFYQPTPVPVGGYAKDYRPPRMGDMARHKNLYDDLELRRKRGITGRQIGHNHQHINNDKISDYYPYISDGTKNMGDYWSDDVVTTAAANHNGHNGKNKHPSPYPHAIVVVPLLQTTREGDVVCDPFHGSGTTGDVATSLGRRYIGYDVKTY